MRAWLTGVLVLGLAGCATSQASRSYEGCRPNVTPLERPPPMVAGYPGVNFTVEAREAWQDTGVKVPRGAQVVIRAQGCWRGWPEELGFFGPEGVRGRPGQPAEAGPEVPWVTPLALMGRLGEDGRPFEVGLLRAFQAEEEGALFLSVNDSHLALEQNEGRLRVRIIVLATGEAPAP